MSITSTHTKPASAPRLPEELVASTTFLLKRLGMTAKERAMKAYEETGLHPYHHAVLVAVGEGPHKTQGAIAERLGYDKGQLVGLLDELEERGLVERERDPQDRRRHVVSLTPDGRRALRRLRSVAQKNEEDFLAPLAEDERASLHALLLRLAETHEPRCAAVLPQPAAKP